MSRAAKKPHETATSEDFYDYAEQWILDNATMEGVLEIPGVAELILDEYNNEIIDAFDEDNSEDD